MLKKTLTLLLALALALSLSTALAHNLVLANDPVLASVNGVEITKSQVEAQLPGLLQEGYIADSTDYRSVLEVMIQQQLILKQIQERGFDQFSPEEISAFEADARLRLAQTIENYASYLLTEDTEEARATAKVQAEASLAAQGFTLEVLLEDEQMKASYERMADFLVDGYEPSQEEIQQVFEEVGASYQMQYEHDIASYEYMTVYNGMDAWYKPEGYRGIVHILLSVPADILNNYQSLAASYEEQQNGDELPVDGEEASAASESKAPLITTQMLEEAKDQVLQSRKADIDMIYQRLEAGESFISLIQEYGEDPGMTDASNLDEGYPVHAQSIVYDPPFTSAAFSEKMQQPGDVSDPVVGAFGIHILMYLQDMPSGLILTEAISQEIEDYLLSVRQNEAFSQELALWKEASDVVYHEEAILQAIQEASEHAISPDEDPQEAP